MSKSKEKEGWKGDGSFNNLKESVKAAKLLSDKRKKDITRAKMMFVHPKGYGVGFWTNRPEKYIEKGEANE